jgi:hypothetical protein
MNSTSLSAPLPQLPTREGLHAFVRMVARYLALCEEEPRDRAWEERCADLLADLGTAAALYLPYLDAPLPDAVVAAKGVRRATP